MSPGRVRNSWACLGDLNPRIAHSRYCHKYGKAVPSYQEIYLHGSHQVQVLISRCSELISCRIAIFWRRQSGFGPCRAFLAMEYALDGMQEGKRPKKFLCNIQAVWIFMAC